MGVPVHAYTMGCFDSSNKEIRMKKTILLGIVLISLLAPMLPASQNVAAGGPIIIYAKPTATGNGDFLSWANACTLQTALAADYPSYQIWVMAGVYMPHPSDRTVSFALKNGAVVFGGFAGTETLLSQRDIKANKTTLSGDIGTAHDISDNSYHVVVAIGTNSTAILNGVSITVPMGTVNTIGAVVCTSTAPRPSIPSP